MERGSWRGCRQTRKVGEELEVRRLLELRGEARCKKAATEKA
jgi:hypothetical protein